jgi:hypothetical protein
MLGTYIVFDLNNLKSKMSNTAFPPEGMKLVLPDLT